LIYVLVVLLGLKVKPLFGSIFRCNVTPKLMKYNFGI